MHEHLLNKKFSQKEIRFRTSIGEDGIPEDLIGEKDVQQMIDKTRGNLVVEYFNDQSKQKEKQRVLMAKSKFLYKL